MAEKSFVLTQRKEAFTGVSLSVAKLHQNFKYCVPNFLTDIITVPTNSLEAVEKYVVWNGETTFDHDERSKEVTFAVVDSQQMVAPEHKRKYLIKSGCDVILIYTCSVGQKPNYSPEGSSFDIALKDVVSGIDSLTYKEFVKRINDHPRMNSLGQQCEAICKESHLNLEIDGKDLANFTMSKVDYNGELIPSSGTRKQKKRANSPKSNKPLVVLWEDVGRTHEPKYDEYHRINLLSPYVEEYPHHNCALLVVADMGINVGQISNLSEAPEFIVWDGNSERPYVPSKFSEDTMQVPSDSPLAKVLVPIDGLEASESDFYLLSIDRLVQDAITNKVDPIVIFGCKSNKRTFERKINGIHRGAFSYCFQNSIERDEKQSLKSLITEINRRLTRINRSVTKQQCEVVCTKERLKLPYLAGRSTSLHYSGHGVENTDLENPRLRRLQIFGKPEFKMAKAIYINLDMCRS